MAKCIYFDQAATTPLDFRVYTQMKPYFFSKFGNASSTHSFGQTTAAAVGKARQQIADFLYCQPEEIYFTSGATESDNLAIKGILEFYQNQFKAKQDPGSPHIITSAFEHPAVLESALAMEKKGCELTLVNPNSNGLISVDSVLQAIKPQTVLISLMYVNNELGTIQPVQELGKRLQVINKERQQQGLSRIYFHIDAVQALNYLNCRPDHLKADLISYSGHKIYGPKGVGMLYIRTKTPLQRQQDGGHQERTLRAGTLNTPGIIGLAAAIDLIKKYQSTHYQKLVELHNQLIIGLKQIPNLHFNTNLESSVPSIVNFRVDNIKAEDLQIRLDLAGIATSTGSACASGAIKASPVLLSLGLDDIQTKASLRLSLGWSNSQAEVKRFLRILNKIIKTWSNHDEN